MRDRIGNNFYKAALAADNGNDREYRIRMAMLMNAVGRAVEDVRYLQIFNIAIGIVNAALLALMLILT